jgi:serine/threonine-protein kinase
VPDLPLNSTFAGCRIEAVAGRGGMGVVYRATQAPLGRAVGLKVVERERASDQRFRARFEREMRLTASIDHPNVIPVYEAGEAEGRLFLVMRWVDGGDLQQLIRERGRLAPPRAVEIVSQVGSALDAAHAAGLVHRDVKPANVLIAGNGGAEHVYLSDFGLTLEVEGGTRITESGDWIGTVDFMAPEQFEGHAVDARTDVYALGCLLHASLTGLAPFPRETVAATILAHLRDPAPRPSATPGVAAAFDTVVERALAKRPEDRFGSARELVEAAVAAESQTADVVRTRAELEHPVEDETSKTALLPDQEALERDGGNERDLDRSPGTVRLGESPRRPTSKVRAAAAMALAALAAGVAALILVVGASGATDDGRPLSEPDVRSTVERFARAYGREDRDALASVLSRDVARVTFTDRQEGRAAVLREYESQFAANTTEGYVLNDLEVQHGALGRASGRYEAPRSGGSPITGAITIGVRREGGQPRIGLIALEPDS